MPLRKSTIIHQFRMLLEEAYATDTPHSWPIAQPCTTLSSLTDFFSLKGFSLSPSIFTPLKTPAQNYFRSLM
jgi:hypothetical protein